TMAIQRSVASIGLVQAFGREAEEYARFHNTVRNSVNTWLKLHWHEVMYWLWIGLIFALSGSAIFGYGGYLIYRGTLTIGALYILLDYLTQLYRPLSCLIGTGGALACGIAGRQRVFAVVESNPILRD